MRNQQGDMADLAYADVKHFKILPLNGNLARDDTFNNGVDIRQGHWICCVLASQDPKRCSCSSLSMAGQEQLMSNALICILWPEWNQILGCSVREP